jgi:hypothetical protein
LGEPVQLSSAREKRWRYNNEFRVESPAVKRRLCVCCSYSEAVTVTALKSVIREQLLKVD